MGSRRPARRAPQDYTEASDFYGPSAPATPPGGAWPPPPLWRSATPPMAPHSTFTPAADDDPFPVPGGVATAPPLGQRRATRSLKHWIGYPLTAVAALTVGLLGASPGEASPEIAAPVSQPSTPATTQPPTPEPVVHHRLTPAPTTHPNCKSGPQRSTPTQKPPKPCN